MDKKKCAVIFRMFCAALMYAACLSQEEDVYVRWISVLTNVADQLYYPCEHIAWAADAELIKAKSDKWWLFSTVLWGSSLLLGILRSERSSVHLHQIKSMDKHNGVQK